MLPVCPLPDPTKTFLYQHPVTLLAMCIWGEARGDVRQAQIGVGCVVRNRLYRHWMGAKTYADVVLRPYQFDCFLTSDPNSAKLLKPTQYDEPTIWDACYYAALQIMLPDVVESVPDITDGAVFYYSKPISAPPKAWGDVVLTHQFGDTWFYKEVT
jgi:hypothetical protein